MPSDRERLATLEANQVTFTRTQEAIFSYMREGRLQREEMVKGFATMTEQMRQSQLYQERCDADRENMEKDLKKQDKRIIATEGFQKTQIKGAVVAGGAISLLVMGGYKAIEKIVSIFS